MSLPLNKFYWNICLAHVSKKYIHLSKVKFIIATTLLLRYMFSNAPTLSCSLLNGGIIYNYSELCFFFIQGIAYFIYSFYLSIFLRIFKKNVIFSADLLIKFSIFKNIFSHAITLIIFINARMTTSIKAKVAN